MKSWKIGDKIKCIDNFTLEHRLILNKVYIITGLKLDFVQIKDDSGSTARWWYKHRFILHKPKEIDVMALDFIN